MRVRSCGQEFKFGASWQAVCLRASHHRRQCARRHRRHGFREQFARIHARLKWTGHLWQGRFSSTAMDERHLLAAARYVPMNPVRAGLVARAKAWPWSSARAQSL